MIEYTLNIKHIDKNIEVLDLSIGKSNHYLKDITPESQYHTFYFEKDKVYANLMKYEVLDIQSCIIVIADSLLTDEDILEHILSVMIRYINKNVFKKQVPITITHTGSKKYDFIIKLISLIEKVQLARQLSMLPANKGTPMVMANTLKKLFKGKAKSFIYDSSYLHKHKFGLIEAVGKSAENPPSMLIIEKIINPKYPTICIIGKGITFDSGGLSLKSYKHIINMKYDKIGAVNGCLALLQLIELNLKSNLIGVFPFAENAVSDRAYRPGDVYTSYLGKTVEITDPDAEGRLILADAIAYAHKYKPDLIIDIATLTGHANSINCWHNGYYFTNSESLKIHVEKRTDEIGERMLPMPTWTEYSSVLQSTVADLVNSPNGKCSDAFVAALFLNEFIPTESDWLHIDLAHEYNTKLNIPNGTGIRTIVHIVQDYLMKKM